MVPGLKGEFETHGDWDVATWRQNTNSMLTRWIHSQQSALLFPVIDSFPQVFVSHNVVKKLAVHATLSTTTSVAQRIRAVERISRSIIGIDEREALCDGLVGICEEYEDGWDSDSDSDDDA